MILFRAVTNEELLNMLHGDNVKINATIRGQNTFRYDEGIEYIHFFKYAEHAFYYKNEKKCVSVIECVIPNDIIEQRGFGLYGSVKTFKNDKLFGYYMPLPEYIIKRDNFDYKYIYDINDKLYNNFIRKELKGNDNEIYGEIVERQLSLFNDVGGYDYRDFSYADLYYELVYKLLKENCYSMEQVTKILLKLDLDKEILLFFKENKDYLIRLVENKDKKKESLSNNFEVIWHNFLKTFKKDSEEELIKKYIRKNKF